MKIFTKEKYKQHLNQQNMHAKVAVGKVIDSYCDQLRHQDGNEGLVQALHILLKDLESGLESQLEAEHAEGLLGTLAEPGCWNYPLFAAKIGELRRIRENYAQFSVNSAAAYKIMDEMYRKLVLKPIKNVRKRAEKPVTKKKIIKKKSP